MESNTLKFKTNPRHTKEKENYTKALSKFKTKVVANNDKDNGSQWNPGFTAYDAQTNTLNFE